MGRSDEYRRYAAECLEMASAVHDPKTRATLLQMAQVWLRLAGQGSSKTQRKNLLRATRERLPGRPPWQAHPRLAPFPP